VAVISLLMGRVCGLDDGEMLDLGVGALMHDIGKIDLPEPLRHFQEDFSPTENRAYESHVAHGVGHAERMALSPSAALVIGQHHEHADGSGFPLRLQTERLSVASRIVSLVNRYDNLCNPHRPATAVTPHEAVALLFAKDRSAFDGAMLGTFIRMLGVYPPGSTVQLTDDRYGLVVGAHSSRPLRPRVRVHDPRSGRDEPLLIDLETTPTLGIRRSLKPIQLPRAALECLSPEPRVVYFFESARPLPGAAECAA
jgi:HD-GYP domain-containing protein (c-di-GMP phosphodiesterase class II)